MSNAVTTTLTEIHRSRVFNINLPGVSENITWINSTAKAPSQDKHHCVSSQFWYRRLWPRNQFPLPRALSRDPSVRHFSTRSGTTAFPTFSSSLLSVSALVSSSLSSYSSVELGPPSSASVSVPDARTRSATPASSRPRRKSGSRHRRFRPLSCSRTGRRAPTI